MQTVNFEKMNAFSSEKMKKTNLFKTDRMLSDLYCFEPGQFQKPHAHSGEDKVYLVLEGEGVFQIDDEEETLSKGSAVIAPAGSIHGVANHSSEALVCLVFMAPLPSHAKGHKH